MVGCIGMLKRKEKSLTVVCVLLSLIVVSPSFLGISSLQTGPRLLSVEEQSSTEWITPTIGSYRETKKVDSYKRIEKWTNGTKAHYASHVYLNDPQCMDMWANFTTWLPENLTTQQTSQSSAASVQPLTEGNLQKYKMDGDIWFINGENSTCFTTYPHDDNYETYHPLEWNLPFALQGLTKTHTHLPKGILDDWVNGNISAAIFVGLCFLGYAAINRLSDGLLGLIVEGGEGIQSKILDTMAEELSKNIDSPLLVAINSLIGWGREVASVWSDISPYYDNVMWTENVVREQFGGDGWTWHGPWYNVGTFFRSTDLSNSKPMTIIDTYAAMGVQATYGTEGIFGTQREFISQWHTKREILEGPPNIVYPPEDYTNLQH